MLADTYPDIDICVFLTQDAILASADSVKKLVDVFNNHHEIGMASGRQLPHKCKTVLLKSKISGSLTIETKENYNLSLMPL